MFTNNTFVVYFDQIILFCVFCKQLQNFDARMIKNEGNKIIILAFSQIQGRTKCLLKHVFRYKKLWKLAKNTIFSVFTSFHYFWEPGCNKQHTLILIKFYNKFKFKLTQHKIIFVSSCFIRVYKSLLWKKSQGPIYLVTNVFLNGNIIIYL